MEIIRSLTREEAIEIMRQRGYGLLSENVSEKYGNSINFGRTLDIGTCLHAQVHLSSMMISLNMVELKYFAQLSMNRFDFFHKEFERYEKIIYLYSRACIDLNENIFQVADSMDGLPKWICGEKHKPLPGLKETKKEKKPMKERKMDFWDDVRAIAKQKGLSKDFALEFFSYWTEHGPKDTTFRKETEKKFDVSRRLDTFVRNEKKWNKTFVDKKVEKQEEELQTRKKTVVHKDLF